MIKSFDAAHKVNEQLLAVPLVCRVSDLALYTLTTIDSL